MSLDHGKFVKERARNRIGNKTIKMKLFEPLGIDM